MESRETDQRAAEALILEHLPDIVTLCNRMFVQRSDAEDATHEAVLGILRSLPTYRGEGPVRHWLLKVALNAARGHRRRLSRQARHATPLVAPEEIGAVATNTAGEREEHEALRRAIAELPDELRAAVVLSHYHGLTQVEIASVVGCSQKTVHQRVRKALAALQQRFAQTPAMGAALVAPNAGATVLDTVAPQLANSVRESIAGHFATTAGTAAGASGQLATGKIAAATGLAAGGLLVQMKLLAGGVALAAACLVGGVLLSGEVRDRDVDSALAMELAETQLRLEDAAARADAALAEVEASRRRSSAGSREQEAMQRLLAQKDRTIAEQERQLAAFASAAVEDEAPGAEKTREARWANIRETIAGVLGVMEKMQEKGANQFQLGPQMVAELGKLSAEDFAEIAAFDAAETDPSVVGTIRAVMLQAFIFIPSTAPLRDEYMGRYLERASSGAFGQGFTERALSRISFAMPPFVDSYAKIVEPLDDELKGRYQEMAYGRIAAGNPESLQLDGARFLARSADPRASVELMRALGEPSSSQMLRLTVVRGLANRSDSAVLRFLQESAAVETDDDVRAELSKAVLRVEQAVARQE